MGQFLRRLWRALVSPVGEEKRRLTREERINAVERARGQGEGSDHAARQRYFWDDGQERGERSDRSGPENQ